MNSLPSNPPIKSLDNIAKVFNGKTLSKSELRKEGFPILKIKDVTDDGQFIPAHILFKSQSS
jgi:hypothetical protein